MEAVFHHALHIIGNSISGPIRCFSQVKEIIQHLTVITEQTENFAEVYIGLPGLP